jgi:hypothetical protein
MMSTTPIASYWSLNGSSTTAVSSVSGPTLTLRTSVSTPVPLSRYRARRHQYFQGFSPGSDWVA